MTAGLLVFPGAQPSRSRNGGAVSAELRFYLNTSLTPTSVYTDATLTTPHPWPLPSDDAGRFPLIWANTALSFTGAWSTADGQTKSYDDLTATLSADAQVAQDAQDAADAAEASADAASASQAAAAASVTAAAGSADEANDAADRAVLAAGFDPDDYIAANGDGGATLTGVIKQDQRAPAAPTDKRSWAISQRSTVTTIPVPSFRPEVANTVIAVDLMPNGTPSESIGNGFAWLDVCNADILDNNNGVWGARIAACSVGARFASFYYNAGSAKPIVFTIDTVDRWLMEATGGHLAPAADNTTSVGTASKRASVVYAGTGSINTSDERAKQDIAPVSDEVLDAWTDVEFVTFRWKDAVAEKGDAARTHVGVVAQRIEAAFAARGLNAFDYGLLCYDEWGPGLDLVDGQLQPGVTGGDRYGIRADECLFLEAALVRRELKRLAASAS